MPRSVASQQAAKPVKEPHASPIRAETSENGQWAAQLVPVPEIWLTDDSVSEFPLLKWGQRFFCGVSPQPSEMPVKALRTGSCATPWPGREPSYRPARKRQWNLRRVIEAPAPESTTPASGQCGDEQWSSPAPAHLWTVVLRNTDSAPLNLIASQSRARLGLRQFEDFFIFRKKFIK